MDWVDWMLGCEQLMLMPVPSVVSADGSCCTWALTTATAEKEGKIKDNEQLQSSDGSFARSMARKSETGMDGDMCPSIEIDSDPSLGVWS